MRNPSPLPAPLVGAPFTSEDARRFGVTASRLRSRDLVHPFHSIHSTVPSADLRRLCEAYLAVMPREAFFSHTTAAALLGVPLPATADPYALHVSVRFPRTPPSGRGVVGHSLSEVSGRQLDGLPMCAAAQVWCQLSGVLSPEDLVATGDHLVGSRRRAPLVDELDLHEASLRLQRTKGAQARAWALPRIRFGVDSRPESLLRLFLSEVGFDGLEINRPVPVLGGAVTLHPDLSIPAIQVAFEYEGDGHRVDRRQWQLDIERRDLLESAGWRVVRVTATDLFSDQAAFLTRLSRFVPNVTTDQRPPHQRRVA